jgi:hypothetical protein
MMAPRTGLSLLAATIAIAAAPASAQAEALVPPGNSAATQYTEAIPTAGGPKATGKPQHRHGSSPTKVLGTHNTAKLDAQGPQGKETAEVAAATAPNPVAPASPGTGEATGHGSSSQTEGGGSTGSARGGGQASGNHSGATAGSSTANHPPTSEPGGSSGLGEVIGQATGSSSSGQLGLILPLAIVAVIAWSIAYLHRQRKRSAA